ncbi:MAG: hypothetical protein ACPKM0_11895, partial [Pleomorphochaeta sp.]
YALSINDFTHNVDIGGGYTNSNLHIFSKNLNLKGPNAYISLEGNLTKDNSLSLVTDITASLLTLDSDSFLVRKNMEDEDLNDVFNNRYMVECFFGIKKYFILNQKTRFFGVYGLHTNNIIIECDELLWMFFNTGFFLGCGINYTLDNGMSINVGYNASIDFIPIYITDFYFINEFNDNIDPSDTFIATSSVAYMSFKIRI